MVFIPRLSLLLISLCIGTLFTIQCSVRDGSPGSISANLASETPQATPEPNVPMSTTTPENRSLFDKSPQYLCDHLVELNHMPWDIHDHSGDALYDALKHNGYYAMPCLVKKITDTRPAENPTGSPFWAGLTYRVGDTAVLMLMDINDAYWPKGMLSKKYEDMFPSEGIFSYYYYVDEVPGARKEVQRWWANWLKTCKPECAKIDSLEPTN